jgi:hypothetical protein
MFSTSTHSAEFWQCAAEADDLKLTFSPSLDQRECAGTSGGDSTVHQLSLISTTLIGFATYKIAMVAATLVPDEAMVVPQKPVEKA